jgi:AcrR family transcriptional regulator
MTRAVVRLWAMSLPTRRPTAEIRELILDAAQHLFREHGYAGTTTKQIAARAGVAESLVFGQFGTKPELFEIAAVAPFRSFVDAYIESWPGIPPEADPETLVKSFVDGFFRLLMENRRILQDCTSESFRGGESAIANLARAVQKDFDAVHVLLPGGRRGCAGAGNAAARQADVPGIANSLFDRN